MLIFRNIIYETKETSVGMKGKKERVIGRINGANPIEGEMYYLRLLVNRVRGPTSFNYLLTVNGNIGSTFKEAEQRRDLLELDQSNLSV